MVLGQLIVMAMLALPAAPVVGEVTMAAGLAQIQRDGRVLRAVVRSGVEPGDRLETGPSGGAAVFLYGGQVIYLGPATALTLGKGAEPALGLERGEVRVTSSGEDDCGFRIVRGGTLVRISRGVIRAAVRSDGMRVWAERGEAVISVEGGHPARLAEGEEALAPPNGALQAAVVHRKSDWTIRVDELQLASAALSSRRMKRERVVETNEATAIAFQQTVPPVVGPPKPPATTSPALPQARPPRPVSPGPVPQPQPPGERAAPPPPPAERGAPPPPPAERSGPNDRLAPPTTGATDVAAYQPIAVDQPVTLIGGSGTFSLALGAVSSSTSSGLSGAGSSDAQQDSVNRSFPGNINLVSAQSKYMLSNVILRPVDRFPSSLEYWSIGLGKPPTSQVATNFRTASSPIPQTLAIPGFNAYLVNFSQYGIPNLATNPVPVGSALGISGLLGASPTSPQIVNATPLTDGRAVFNNRATFALGEFAVGSSGSHPFFETRRSDQDRQIIKSPTGNDDNDIVRPNPFVTFTAVKDSKFFPGLPYVEVPAQSPLKPILPLPTYGGLSLIEKAGFTTLMADSLYAYSRRTGQTRFVVDHRIVDVTGYRPPHRIDPMMLHASGVSPAANAISSAASFKSEAGASALTESRK